MIFFTAIKKIDNDSKFHKQLIIKKELIWGITELSSSTFNKIKNGDYICFYHKSHIIAISKVFDTKTDKDKSIDLFGSYNHQFKGELFWSNLLYLSFLSEVNIEFNLFLRLGKYSPKFAVRKLIGLNQNGNNEILKKYSSYDNFINELINKH
jgi:hypothetical protein